ncbi:MAG: SDR family NAD(P)-dependent oxidoreductase [Burkholderiaceae bacterium]
MTMLSFPSGAVAVVTGAALGIGRALAEHLAGQGVSVVMADLPGADLTEAHAQVTALAINSASVLAVPTDVSVPAQIEKLQAETLSAFGRVDMLVNNAVTRIGRGMEAPLEEWQQAMQVNLWGPIFAVRAFVPHMLQSSHRCFVVNVGSKQGMTNPPGHPVYNVSKAALKTYTEALQHDLRGRAENQVAQTRVTAHLLVPGWTTTGKNEHKPGAWRPIQVVEHLMKALLRDDFYIVCADDEVTPEMDRQRIVWAAHDITENRPPLSRWHPDFAEAAARACNGG